MSPSDRLRLCIWFKYDVEKRGTLRKCQDGENLKGWHTGAGMSYLYNSDVKHYRDNFWATADMKRLAGTTTLENEEPKGTDVKKSSKTFVGGTNSMTNMLVSEWILKIRTKL